MTGAGAHGARPGKAVPYLEDLPDPAGKAALVRATFDRPLGADPAHPLAFARAQWLAATVGWLIARGARVTVCGDTAASGPAEDAGHLERIRRSVLSLVSPVPAAGAVAFRSCPEEPGEVAQLVEAHDLFVNETLQDSCLPLPSLTLPPLQLPSAAGRSVEHDLGVLDPLLTAPPRPFVAVLGGERSYDRLRGLQGLVLRADVVLLGGALALPFLHALGKQPATGTPDDFVWECRTMLGLAGRVHHRIVLPVDLVWRSRDGSTVVAPADVRAGEDVVDIGPLTRVRFGEVLRGAAVSLWTGALGQVEAPASTGGTFEVAAAFDGGSRVLLGGDALLAALEAAHRVPPSAEVLSAADGAIELLKAGDLPGLAALRHQ